MGWSANHEFMRLVKRLILNYFAGSILAVLGVGGVLIFTTLHLTRKDLEIIGAILGGSLALMLAADTVAFRAQVRPIRKALVQAHPTEDVLAKGYRRALHLPALAVLRVMGPHWLSFLIPGLVSSSILVRRGLLHLPMAYVWLASLGTLIVASMHAVIEFFLTSRTIEPTLVAIRRRSEHMYGASVWLRGQVVVPLAFKFAMSSVVFGALPLLLFGLANAVRLTNAGFGPSTYWTWAGGILAVGSLFSAFGGYLLASDVQRPIRRLEALMRRVERGDFSLRADDTYMDEFSDLIQGFNLMLSGLAQRDALNRQLIESYFATLAAALDARDPYTAGHSQRVARYAEAIGRKVNLSPQTVRELRQSALLHDIGKIGIRDEILLKEGKLTDEEFAIIKQHPVIGENIIRQIQPDDAMKPLLPGIRSHHERYDGKGYPDGLAGEEIPLFGRILAVADAFDAMTSDRPYRSGMPAEKAIQVLREGRGTQWDPHFVDAFIEVYQEVYIPDEAKSAAREAAASTSQ